MLNINIRGTLDLVRLSLPHIIKAPPTKPDGERGVLILVSSSAAFDGQPGQVAYAESYKYVYLAELLDNVIEARQVFER